MMNRTQTMMMLVLACLLPGIATSTYWLGAGILINIGICIATVFAWEVAIAKIRDTNLASAWDGSGFVTALLLALCLPPDLHWGIVMFGASFSILFGKSLYGGLGHNPFNPAMVGYCALIVCFPLAMSLWPAVADGLSGATALDTMKWREGSTIDEIWQIENGFGQFGGYGYEWIAAAYLTGGVALLALRVIKWHGPIAFLATIFVLAVLFYAEGGSNSFGSPLFHLFAGGTMFAAFFIITDPVTTPETAKGMLLFGIGAGLLTFIIRTSGAYPDGIAFAILLMNALVPLYEQARLRTA
jgi:electron transport complex protein RnfD